MLSLSTIFDSFSASGNSETNRPDAKLKNSSLLLLLWPLLFDKADPLDLKKNLSENKQTLRNS